MSETSGRVRSARERYEEVSSRGEAALLSGDPEQRAAWLADMERAEAEVKAAQSAPPWRTLLADPTWQPAGTDAVTASILAYRDAPLASACACGGSIHKAVCTSFREGQFGDHCVTCGVNHPIHPQPDLTEENGACETAPARTPSP